MWWIAGVIALVALLVVGVATWMLAPTVRALRGPAFTPTPRDEASVLRAEQSGMVDGGQ
jgi:hypothetical protein